MPSCRSYSFSANQLTGFYTATLAFNELRQKIIMGDFLKYFNFIDLVLFSCYGCLLNFTLLSYTWSVALTCTYICQFIYMMRFVKGWAMYIVTHEHLCIYKTVFLNYSETKFALYIQKLYYCNFEDFTFSYRFFLNRIYGF